MAPNRSIAGGAAAIPSDRFAGCLLGLALGDAFGDRKQAQRHHG
jgi:ADP-ribosylglycohydrolase